MQKVEHQKSNVVQCNIISEVFILVLAFYSNCGDEK